MEDKISLVDKQVEAYNKGDLESFSQCYHPDVTVQKLNTNEVIVRGIEAFNILYKKLFKDFPQQKCHIKSRMALNDLVIDEELITGRPKNPEGIKCVAIYGFKNGLIDRVWFI